MRYSRVIHAFSVPGWGQPQPTSRVTGVSSLLECRSAVLDEVNSIRRITGDKQGASSGVSFLLQDEVLRVARTQSRFLFPSPSHTIRSDVSANLIPMKSQKKKKKSQIALRMFVGNTASSVSSSENQNVRGDLFFLASADAVKQLLLHQAAGASTSASS